MNNVFHAFLMMPLVTYAREPVPVHAPIISEEFKLLLQMYYSHYVMYKFSRINLVILTEMAKIRSHEKSFRKNCFRERRYLFAIFSTEGLHTNSGRTNLNWASRFPFVPPFWRATIS